MKTQNIHDNIHDVTHYNVNWTQSCTPNFCCLGEMGATANNNAVINCYLLYEVLVFVLYRCILIFLLVNNQLNVDVQLPSASLHHSDRFSHRSIM